MSRRQRAATALAARGQAAVSACSGTIVAGTLYSCQNPSSTGTDSYTLSLPAGPNALVFQITNGAGFSMPITVTAPGGTALNCQQSPLQTCPSSQAGTYTLAVASSGTTYTLEFTALLSQPQSACPAISLSFAGPVVTGALTAGQVGPCYSVSAPAGHNLFVYAGPYGKQVYAAIFDASGNLVCAQVLGTCALTGTGPYRLLANNAGQAGQYEFQVADLTQPAGCVSVPLQAYGQVPALSAAQCAALTVTAQGSYQIYNVDQHFATQPGTLFTASGSQACSGGGWSCQLAPGSYTYVQDNLQFGDRISTVFVDAASGKGCAAASDTSFATGDATGTFSGPGQELCRTVPTPAGLADYLYSQPVSTGTQGQVLGVVDAQGAQVCPAAFAYSSFGTCTLTGTAPFRVILVPTGPHGSVRLLVQRTNSTAGCGPLPQSGYGTAAGATTVLTRTGNARCFAIPAAARSAANLVEDADLTDGASAALTVNSPSGQQLCAGNGYPTSWAICDYKTGVRYTAILLDLQFPAKVASERYYLARRDITAHAACAPPASTTPGGPSTAFTLGSSVAARCFRVSAAKADKLIFGLRATAPTDSSAFQVPSTVLLVTNGSGAVVCSWMLYCPATGATTYQAIALTLDYTDVAIAAHLDSWLVGTAAGWAPACQQHQYSTGATSPAVAVRLTDGADLYCAVVNAQPNQELSFYGSDNAAVPFPSPLEVNAYPASSWANPSQNLGICSVGTSWCDILPVQQAEQALLIVTPYGVTPYGRPQVPISLDMQAVCDFGCTTTPAPPVYKSITPASQPAGPGDTVVLTGTGLNFKTPFDLVTANGSQYSPAVPVSVNTAGTRLTLRLDTSQVPPGSYDVTTGDSCSPGPCPDWLINAYKVTAGPKPPPATRFVPVTPARVMNTSTGFGIRRGAVPAHRTVTFAVAGRGGVPSTGVAAVLLDVSAVGPSRAGFVTAFPAGAIRPRAQTADFTAGRSATGLVAVPAGRGRVAVYNGSPGTVNLTADVVGYQTLSATAGTGFSPVGPAQLLAPARVSGGRALTLQVAGRSGVPVRGVAAVALNVTVRAARAGTLIVHAVGTARPRVTSLTFAAGQAVTGLIISKVGNGKVYLYNASGGAATLTVDAVGYYSAGGGTFHPVNAPLVMNTGTGFGGAGGPIPSHAAALLSPLWNAVVSPSANVTAVALNLTVLDAGRAGTLTAFPDGALYEDGVTLPNSTSLPGTPNIAFRPGQAQSDLVIVPTSGLADFYNGSGGSIDVLAALEGYYTKP